MATSVKLRTLYIMKILLEKTDEEHVLSAADLNRELEAYGMSIDRKTVYTDIEILRDYGLDIGQRYGSRPGYYMMSREFELTELKLLVDAVQVSKFITKKKSEELIRKLEKLTSENEAKLLQRNVFIYNRPKTGNERIYYNVDYIHTALLENYKIRFQYAEWTLKKELVAKHDGRMYQVSPWALTWDDENYYLIAFDENSGGIRHYRVDKMMKTEVVEEPREGKEAFVDFDLVTFARKTFGMYGGMDADVTFRCENRMIGIVMDRFGKDTMIIPDGEEHFKFHAVISVSPQFFGWVTGIGKGLQIMGPGWVRDEYKEYMNQILTNY